MRDIVRGIKKNMDTRQAAKDDALAKAVAEYYSNLTFLKGCFWYDESEPGKIKITKRWGGKRLPKNLVLPSHIDNKQLYLPDNCKDLFAFTECKSIDLSNIIDTSNIISTESMFQFNSDLEKVYLGKNFDSSNVLNMSSMFFNCNRLIDIDSNHLNTTNVEKLNDMFSTCSAINFLDLSNFNTINVKDISYMFYGCESLETIDISNFRLDSMVNIKGVFLKCTSLLKVNLPDFYNLRISDDDIRGICKAPGMNVTEDEHTISEALQYAVDEQLAKRKDKENPTIFNATSF